jgi:hypothetical protein
MHARKYVYTYTYIRRAYECIWYVRTQLCRQLENRTQERLPSPSGRPLANMDFLMITILILALLLPFYEARANGNGTPHTRGSLQRQSLNARVNEAGSIMEGKYWNGLGRIWGR